MYHYTSTILESLEYLVRIREPNTRQFGCPSVPRFIASSPFRRVWNIPNWVRLWSHWLTPTVCSDNKISLFQICTLIAGLLKLSMGCAAMRKCFIVKQTTKFIICAILIENGVVLWFCARASMWQTDWRRCSSMVIGLIWNLSLTAGTHNFQTTM